MFLNQVLKTNKRFKRSGDPYFFARFQLFEDDGTAGVFHNTTDDRPAHILNAKDLLAEDWIIESVPLQVNLVIKEFSWNHNSDMSVGSNIVIDLNMTQTLDMLNLDRTKPMKIKVLIDGQSK